jgi:hypothetical protein
MTRTMYDSTTAADIPLGAKMVAGYVDGRYRWSDGDWARFPNAIKVRISIFGVDDGDAGDIEVGCMTPAQGVDWARRRLAAGLRTVACYVNRSNRAEVEQLAQRAGIRSDQLVLWVATLDGTRTVAPGPYPVVAVQYANPALSGGHYDLSEVADYWPGVDEMPQTFPRDPSSGSIYMLVWNQQKLITEKYRFKSPADWAPYEASGAVYHDVTDQTQLKNLLALPDVTPLGALDLSPVLAAIADLKAHPAAIADPAVLAIVTRIETALRSA